MPCGSFLGVATDAQIVGAVERGAVAGILWDMQRTIVAILAGVAVTAAVGSISVFRVWWAVQEYVAWLLPTSVPDPLYGVIADGVTFAVLGLPGVVVAVLLARRREYPRGHCRACGYNLRGNVSGVWPECGEPA